MLRSSWVAADLAASQDVPSSMKLVSLVTPWLYKEHKQLILNFSWQVMKQHELVLYN
jgi:hypothetical protein